jgi:hypothetical protein
MLDSVCSIYFAYCLHQRSDKVWIILNRNYKPVGTLSDEWVDYDSIPSSLCIQKITRTQAAKLSYDGSPENTGRIYLYDDGCTPTLNKKHMDAYLSRISVLMSLRAGGVNDR